MPHDENLLRNKFADVFDASNEYKDDGSFLGCRFEDHVQQLCATKKNGLSLVLDFAKLGKLVFDLRKFDLWISLNLMPTVERLVDEIEQDSTNENLLKQASVVLHQECRSSKPLLESITRQCVNKNPIVRQFRSLGKILCQLTLEDPSAGNAKTVKNLLSDMGHSIYLTLKLGEKDSLEENPSWKKQKFEKYAQEVCRFCQDYEQYSIRTLQKTLIDDLIASITTEPSNVIMSTEELSDVGAIFLNAANGMDSSAFGKFVWQN